MGGGECRLELASMGTKCQHSAAENLGDRRGYLGAIGFGKDNPGRWHSQSDSPWSRTAGRVGPTEND
jgi:hypothetical protein